MSSVLIWIILICLLCLSTFGLWFCLLISLSVFSVITGFLLILYAENDVLSNSHPEDAQNYKKQNGIYIGIPKVISKMQKPRCRLKYNQKLTGSKKIDEVLHEIIKHVNQDFICSWYKYVSTDDEFVFCINELFKKVIQTVSDCAKDVQWVSFFTRQIVEDLASHLRIYKHAEKTFRKAKREKSEKYSNLESAFFDFELRMEKDVCHDSVCTSSDDESDYLRCLSNVFLYLLLPPQDFDNKILRIFLRELLAIVIFQSTIFYLSDPDFINQNLVWMCKSHPMTNKAFLSVIQRTDSNDELSAIEEIVKHELKVLKSKDTGDKDDIKQCIKSVAFVQNVIYQIRQRISKLRENCDTDSVDYSMDIDWETLVGLNSDLQLISLPFDIVLNNNIALHYFTEFMTSIGLQGYIFFYHNIEGYRAAAEIILAEEEYSEITEVSKREKLQEFASHLFDTHLGKYAVARIDAGEVLLDEVYSRITAGTLTQGCFDEIQKQVYDFMQRKFNSTEFKESSYYVKLLAELDLLNDFPSMDSDSLSVKSSEDEDQYDYANFGPVNSDDAITNFLNSEVPPSNEYQLAETTNEYSDAETVEIGKLCAEIYNTGITHHAGKTFAVYAIAVTHYKSQGTEERWFVVRRYSEFREFHGIVTDKFPQLSSLHFPSKKAFNNLSRQLMEKRREALNEYLQSLLSPDVFETCKELQMMLYKFLEPEVFEKGKKSLIRTVGTLVNPIRTSVKTVGNIMKLVPDTLFGLKHGLLRAFRTASVDGLSPLYFETDKISVGLDLAADDIPLRILLLLMDEIFDLKSKDLWFRRRIVILLRHIIKTTQGGAINRKIEEYVKNLTSAAQVAEWLRNLCQAFWPNGVSAEPQVERDYNTKMRTQIAAKTLLFCSIPDEVKHIIGSATCFKGAMIIFNMFQYSCLNRRLFYVLLESFVKALFPKNNFPLLFQQLFSKSSKLVSMLSAKEECLYLETSSSNSKSKFYKMPLYSSDHFISKCKENLKLYNGKLNEDMEVTIKKSANVLPSKLVKKLTKKKKRTEMSVFYTESDTQKSESVPNLSSTR